MPIGIEDFAELRQKGYRFIDKSLFIKDLLDKSPKVLLMTRPRRFGKTLLMSMVKYFFSLENGKEHIQLFKNLNIEKAGEQYMEEQGKRPVVMLSLKDCKASSWESMQERLKTSLSALYRQYAFLLEHGSLNGTDRRYFDVILNEEAKQVACTLTIPNEEIRGIYSREVLRHISGGESTSVLTRLMRNLLSGNADLFQQDLRNMLLQMTSVYDTANEESFYHGFLLGMTALLVPQYEVQSNRESGEGRFDLAIFPKSPADFGVILEFKTAATGEQLEERADEALRQIEEKDYMQSFANRGIPDSHVLKYGIAFCGKQVGIR